jgi:unsaturated rhamnogalacturonyl hydrolase
LSSRFGIRFNEDNFNLVKENNFEQGAILIPSNHSIFRSARKIFVKELATLSIAKPASASISSGDKVIVATANHGKGKVFVMGDPWLYNEYVDGRKLPSDYQNHAAAMDLVKWALKNSKK